MVFGSSPGGFRGFQRHVLLVEDDDLVRDQVQRQLVALGCRVTAHRNGHDALRRLDAGATRESVEIGTPLSSLRVARLQPRASLSLRMAAPVLSVVRERIPLIPIFDGVSL